MSQRTLSIVTTRPVAAPLRGNVWGYRPTKATAEKPAPKPRSVASLPLELRWLNGQPPHVGWWCASARGDYGDWRWWDGHLWSQLAKESDSLRRAGQIAARPAREKQTDIRWCEFWPADARVMREDPYSKAMKGRLPAPSVWQGPEASGWNQGEPPHVGWWNAASTPREDIWRWWNGFTWSAPVSETCDETTAAKQARVPSELPLSSIRWTHRWPEYAAPRQDPRERQAQALLARIPKEGQAFPCRPPAMTLRFERAPRSELVRRDSTPQYARKGDAIVVDADRRRSVVPWGQFVENYQFNTSRGMCQLKRAPLKARELLTREDVRKFGGQPGDFLVWNNQGVHKVVPRRRFLQRWSAV